ncbi:glycosyltransferase family 2 protein [Nonlabens ulvanivorans]|uniref:glycosyltransferase family 2 protein n=1 Tax=Nonlabens ulvanivorans TaxID=906888 RepID=UPI0032649912
MELVSVIMPTYNSALTLKEALDSIIHQSYRPIEIITIDDASNDNSLAIAKSYAQQQSTKDVQFVTLSNDVNAGAGISRNKGVEKASGTYIAFLDADDIWKPEKLTTQINAMKSQNATVCYGAYEIFKTSPDQPISVHKVFEKLTYDKLHKTNYLGNLTGIYNASVLGKITIPSLRKRQDWAMWLDVLKKAEFAIGIQEPIASYRLSDGLSANKIELIKHNYAVYRKHLGYSAMKSYWNMMLFFYEQFLVKKKMIVSLEKKQKESSTHENWYPDKILIEREEDYHTHYLGELNDGRLFFGYSTFIFPNGFQAENWQESRLEYVVVYLFDNNGEFLEVLYKFIGKTKDVQIGESERLLLQLLQPLGKLKFRSIEVKPFSTIIDGFEFGLIPDDEIQTIELQPSSTIAFSAPWNGEYDT